MTVEPILEEVKSIAVRKHPLGSLSREVAATMKKITEWNFLLTNGLLNSLLLRIWNERSYIVNVLTGGTTTITRQYIFHRNSNGAEMGLRRVVCWRWVEGWKIHHLKATWTLVNRNKPGEMISSSSSPYMTAISLEMLY